MPELKEVFDVVTKQTEPEVDSWREQEQRQRRYARNRRIGAVAVAAAIVIALVLAVLVLPKDVNERTGGPGPSGQLPTEPPLGATIVSVDGTVVSRVPGVPSDALGLEMSPDGRTIAFVAGDRVGLIGSDGTGLRYVGGRLRNSEGDAHLAVAWSNGPSWTPDGALLINRYD
jgi:hypothetical protein